MSAVSIDKTEEVVSELPQPKGPGARLKAAREAKGISEDTIAEAIFLKIDTLRALENDDFASLPGRVYVTGYLKKYARQVGIPEASIIKALNDFSPAQEKPVTTATHHYKFDTRRDVSTRRSNGFPFFKLLFLILIGAGGYIAWQQQWFSGMTVPKMNFDVTGLASLQSDPVDRESDAGNIALPMQIESDDLSPVKSETAPLSLPAIVAVEPVIDESNADVETSKQLIEIKQEASVASASESEEVKTITEAVEGQFSDSFQSAEPVTAEVTEPALVSNGVTLTFTQTCWVDIRDNSRSYKFINQARPGQSITLEGTAPYKILLGNVRGVEMTVNGKLYDLAQHERANVARFVLDPASL